MIARLAWGGAVVKKEKAGAGEVKYKNRNRLGADWG